MWPFRRRKIVERGALWPPGRGPDPVGGDPFWSWGSLGAASTVTPAMAENLAAVTSAVSIISGAIAGLPAFVTLSDDTRAEVPSHPLQALINSGPNDAESWSDFVEGLVANMLLRGNALAEIETGGNGRLTGLRTLPWAQVTPRITDQGSLLFDFVSTVPPNAGKRQTFSRADCLFVKDRSDNGIIGTSRLQRAAGALSIALQTQTDSGTFMNWSSRPSGILTSDVRIPDHLADRYKQDFEVAYSKGNQGKVALLGNGMKWEKLSALSAEDAQIVGLKNFSVADIARIFSVPLYLLADPNRATFASARESSRHFGMTCLMPHVRKLERAFSQSVLGPEYRLQLDLGDLLRADPEARWQSWQRARLAGVLSPNDVRAEEGWPASNDPTADSIAPPVAGAAAVSDQAPTGTTGKVIHLEEEERHAAD